MNLETVFDNVLTLYVKKLLAKEIAIDRRYQSDGYTINRYSGGDSPRVLNFAAECDGSCPFRRDHQPTRSQIAILEQFGGPAVFE